MAIDIDTDLLDPIYDRIGVPATLDMGTAGGEIPLTVIDKRQGVLLESANNPLQVATSKPAACVRLSELAANSLTRETLRGLRIAFSGGSWIIKATQPKPKGATGELYLILQD